MDTSKEILKQRGEVMLTWWNREYVVPYCFPVSKLDELFPTHVRLDKIAHITLQQEYEDRLTSDGSVVQSLGPISVFRTISAVPRGNSFWFVLEPGESYMPYGHMVWWLRSCDEWQSGPHQVPTGTGVVLLGEWDHDDIRIIDFQATPDMAQTAKSMWRRHMGCQAPWIWWSWQTSYRMHYIPTGTYADAKKEEMRLDMCYRHVHNRNFKDIEPKEHTD